MARRQLHKLTARQAETITEPGRHGDGGGLYLVVGEGGARSWLFMFKTRGTGKRRELGLGSASKRGGVSLAGARDKAEAARKQLSQGQDPVAIRRAESLGDDTFGVFGDALLESIKPGFKGRGTHNSWKRDLTVHCKPLRPKRCKEITTADVLEVLKPLWLTKARTARELRGRIERVLEAADPDGTRKNPADGKRLKEHLPKQRKSKRHHRAAPFADVPGIVKELHAKHQAADTDVNRAAEFIILTAVRTGEARFMRVGEVDFPNKLWTVPAERMKTEDDPEGKPHEVPLCARAVAVLKEVIAKDAPPDAYVFSGQWCNDGSKPLGMNAVLHALKDIYPQMTTHGCRSSFRDWAGDETHFPREVAEAALAHKVGDEAEQAYRRGTALAKRRKLMEAWGAYVVGSHNVVPLQGQASQSRIVVA